MRKIKYTIKHTKKKVCTKTLKILMIISIILGGIQLADLALDHIVFANADVIKATLPNVTIENGASLHFGNSLSTYVGGDTVLSGRTSGRHQGDQSSIDGAESSVWNAYFGKDRAASLNILKKAGIPSIADVTNWKSYGLGNSTTYWLSDLKDVIAQGREENQKIIIPTRAYANNDSSLSDKTLTINGKYKNELDAINNGALFTDRNVHLGSYATINSENMEFDAFVQKAGYYRDIMGEAFYDYGDVGIVFPETNYEDGKIPATGSNWPVYIGKPLAAAASRKEMLLYATPDCNPEDRREASFEIRPAANQLPSNLLIYDKASDTFRIPVVGEKIPVGTILAYPFANKDTEFKDPATGYSRIFRHLLLNTEGLQTLGGRALFGEDIPPWVRTKPTTNPYVYKNSSDKDGPGNPIYLLYHKTLVEYKAVKNTVGGSIQITEGFAYVSTDFDVPPTIIKGDEKAVRPKMTLETSKIKFARNSSDNTIPSNSAILGEMPTTELKKSYNYKLVLDSDALGINKLAAGTSEDENTTRAASGGNTPYAKISENSIFVSPGTETITIPVSAKGGNKISAISTKRDGTTLTYGIVGDANSGSITVNIADLINTNTLGESKTITLYNEQINGLTGTSDEISTEGLDITIKVENPQAVDFTDDTKTNVLNETYQYGEEFTVEAEVIEMGAGGIGDTTTPLIFKTNEEYLKLVKKSDLVVETDKATGKTTKITQTATFKVVQPNNNATGDVVKIKLSRNESSTHDAAPEVMSTDVKTDKRPIYLKFDPEIFSKNLGGNTSILSLNVGSTWTDISEKIKYKMDVSESALDDSIAVADAKAGNIPYTIKTKHFLGDSSNDTIPIGNGKILESANGNIWIIKIKNITDSTKNDWFNARYVIKNIIDDGSIVSNGIVSVYDNINPAPVGSMYDYVMHTNNIIMTLADYENSVSGLTGTPLQTKMIELAKGKITHGGTKGNNGNGSSVFNAMGSVIINGKDNHAGTYPVDFKTMYIDGAATLIIADHIVNDANRNEEVYGNNIYMSVAEAKTFTDEQLMSWSQIAAKNTYTGARVTDGMFDIVGRTNIKADKGEYKVSLVTSVGKTSLTTNVFVRDNAKEAGNIRGTSNNLKLTVDEATELVKQLDAKTKVEEKVGILTPPDTTSKYGIYPQFIKTDTGNRVAITSIDGLPTIASGDNSVKDGFYTITFKTATGESVEAKILVYVADPTDYVEIPTKIKLTKSLENGFEATSTTVDTDKKKVEQVKLIDGKGQTLEDFENSIIVKIPSTFNLTGTKEGNQSTQMKVGVYDILGMPITSTDTLTQLVELNKDTTSAKFVLKITKKDSQVSKDYYLGTMTFHMSYSKKISESGG